MKKSKCEVCRTTLITFAIFFSVLFLFLSMQIISAADIAYIYKSKGKINNQVLEVFFEMNLSADLIVEKNISKTDFSKYKLIFVGDERFSKPSLVPVNKYPSVIANYYHGYKWGLTDRDGISKLGGTEPLSVRKDNKIIQVYNKAVYDEKKISIPYYFLANGDKTPAMQKIAGTYTGDAYELGDVISYVKAGTNLINGKNADGNICFFGIIESKYWTSEARQLFKDCINLAGATCSGDSDCPSDSIGELYCKDGNVFQDISDFKCVNPGTVFSKCMDGFIPKLLQNCSFGCKNGQCKPECSEDSDCSNGKVCINNSCVIVECRADSDCGADRFLNQKFCENNNVFDKYLSFDCINPGESDSYCTNLTENKKIQKCDYGCENGACKQQVICSSDSECNDNNSSTHDQCVNPGTPQSFCEHHAISCKKDSDCGVDGFLNQTFCNSEHSHHVFDKYRTFKCNSPDTPQSYCSSSVEDKIFKDCAIGLETCYNGMCVSVGCSSDSDCGADKFLNQKFCENNNVFDKYLSFDCINPGESDSYCTNSTQDKEVQQCTKSCLSGACINIECNDNEDCDDSDLYTYDQCNNPGTSQSYCTHTTVNCVTDGDCGITAFFGDEFCLFKDVYKNYQESKCINPKTTLSYCNIFVTQKSLIDCGEDFCEDFSQNYCKEGDVFKSRNCYEKGCANRGCFSMIKSEEKLVQDCSFGCSNGNCLPECNTNADCSLGKICINNSCVPSPCTDNDKDNYDNCVPGDNGDDGKQKDCNDNNANINPGKAEICNGVDDDCDGMVDEGIADIINGTETGECEKEIKRCINGSFVVVQPKIEPSPETCDNKDNDCDGMVDENNGNCPSGKICSSGECKPVVCNENSDCGANGFTGVLFCQNNDVYQNFVTYTCNFPGTVLSYCSNSTSAQLKTDCVSNQFCSNGQCIKQCIDNDSDSYDACAPGETGDDGKQKDCNDNNADVNPGKKEICGNFIDDNCNGEADEGCKPITFTNFDKNNVADIATATRLCIEKTNGVYPVAETFRLPYAAANSWTAGVKVRYWDIANDKWVVKDSHDYMGDDPCKHPPIIRTLTCRKMKAGEISRLNFINTTAITFSQLHSDSSLPDLPYGTEFMSSIETGKKICKLKGYSDIVYLRPWSWCNALNWELSWNGSQWKKLEWAVPGTRKSYGIIWVRNEDQVVVRCRN